MERRGYGNGDEVVRKIHEEVDGRPEVEGIVRREGALALNKHANTNIKPSIFLIPASHVMAV